jgi:hypothetical protein
MSTNSSRDPWLTSSSLSPQADRVVQEEEAYQRQIKIRKDDAPLVAPEDALRVRGPPNVQETNHRQEKINERNQQLKGTENNPIGCESGDSYDEMIESLDCETLNHVERFIDRLHTQKGLLENAFFSKQCTPGLEDWSPSQQIGMSESQDTVDSQTRESVDKFISVLSHDDQELADELNLVMSKSSFDTLDPADVRPEMLLAIGNYIDAVSGKSRGASSTEEEATSTTIIASRSSTSTTISIMASRSSHGVMGPISETMDNMQEDTINKQLLGNFACE